MPRLVHPAFQRNAPHIVSLLIGFLVLTLGAGQAFACPNWQLTGSQASVDANSLWLANTFNVTAGGNVDLGRCGDIPGQGWVATAPDFTIAYDNLNLARDLDIRINGTCDTVLLVNDAIGQWHFSDDVNGTINPRLHIPDAPSGSYDIWVGTFSQGNCGASMAIETNDASGGTPAPAPPPPPPPPPVIGNVPPPFSRTVLADPGNLTAWRGRNGQIASFAVTPANSGSVRGTDIYTDDSSLATAAVHAGLLLPGQTGIVTVVIRPGQSAYAGTPRNGVQTQNFASWGGSFSFVFP